MNAVVNLPTVTPVDDAVCDCCYEDVSDCRCIMVQSTSRCVCGEAAWFCETHERGTHARWQDFAACAGCQAPLALPGRCEECGEVCPCCGDYRVDCACRLTDCGATEPCRETGAQDRGVYCEEHRRGVHV
jgi:hypothetical protein